MKSRTEPNWWVQTGERQKTKPEAWTMRWEYVTNKGEGTRSSRLACW